MNPWSEDVILEELRDVNEDKYTLDDMFFNISLVCIVALTLIVIYAY